MLPDEATLRATMAQHKADTGCTNCADCSTLCFLLGVIDAERLKHKHFKAALQEFLNDE